MRKSSSYDSSKTLKFLNMLGHLETGNITEVRIFPKSHMRGSRTINNQRVFIGRTVSGYYDNYAKLVEDIAPFDGVAQVYITLNPVKSDLLARAANRLEYSAEVTTDDPGIAMDLWFQLDFDPVRPTSISSSDSELELAKGLCEEACEFLCEFGVAPIIGLSGNGYHALIRLTGYPNTTETFTRKERLLKFLSEKFSTDKVKLDETTFNPSRIWKLYGTMAVKGDSLPERPHRRSTIGIPDTLPDSIDLYALIPKIIPADWRVAATTKPDTTTAPKDAKYAEFDVDGWLKANKIAVAYKREKDGGTIWRLAACVFNTEHVKDAQLRREANGRLGFVCPHNSCKSYSWKDFAAKVGSITPFLISTKAKQQAESAKAKAAKGKAESDENRSAGGLYEGDAYYYRYVEVGEGNYQEKPISSFIIKPNLRVWMDGKENLTASFVTATATYRDVVIRRRDWNGRDRFMDAFPSVDLQWNGNLNDVQNVLAIVASYDVPTKQGTTQLGRHDSGLWLLPNGTAYNHDGLVDDLELVYLPAGGRGELDDKIRITELSDAAYQELLGGIYSNIFALNLSEVILPVIGWFMSTPFKPLVQQKYRGFPLLSVSGRTGAGKSSLLDLMWELMGIGGSGGKLFSCTETDFVILKLLSATTSIPLVFDEYKPFDMPPLRLKALTRMLRKCYDGEKELRGRPDQTTVEYSLTAPVAIAGEVPLTEGALLERIVTVSLSKNKLNNIMRKAYGAMRGLNLSAFMSRYIPFCLNANFDRELNRAEVLTTDLIPGFDDIADRIRKNLVVMTFGFNQFMRFGKEFDIDCGDLTPALAEALTAAKNAVCGEDGITKDALDDMLGHLATMAETGRLVNGRDYIIRGSYEDIALRFNSCFAEFRKYHRETQLDGEMLNAPAYKGLLKENHERGGYIEGTNINVKFKGSQKKAVIIDPKLSESVGIDISGFFGNEDDV